MNRDCGPAAQFDSPLLVQNITVAFKTKSQSGSLEDDYVMFSYHIIISFSVKLESPPARHYYSFTQSNAFQVLHYFNNLPLSS